MQWFDWFFTFRHIALTLRLRRTQKCVQKGLKYRYVLESPYLPKESVLACNMHFFYTQFCIRKKLYCIRKKLQFCSSAVLEKFCGNWYSWFIRSEKFLGNYFLRFDIIDVYKRNSISQIWEKPHNFPQAKISTLYCKNYFTFKKICIKNCRYLKGRNFRWFFFRTFRGN